MRNKQKYPLTVITDLTSNTHIRLWHPCSLTQARVRSPTAFYGKPLPMRGVLTETENPGVAMKVSSRGMGFKLLQATDQPHY